MYSKIILPFPRSYWIIPGKFLAGHVPTDKDMFLSDKKISNLLNLGINCFINLQDKNEKDDDGNLFPKYEDILDDISKSQGRKICFYRFPVTDLSTPSKEFMKEILDTIDNSINKGLNVYIHCWGGIGRTGTVVGCYLIRHKMASKDNVIRMIEYLRRTDPKTERISPETEEQIKFVQNWDE
ncbi:MAG: dual specificity protein phosphatase family protein [Bacteroidota bacterium]